ATADLNGDGNLDLAVCNSFSNNLSILLGNGSGSFGSATNYATGAFPNDIQLADFNNDGKQDVVVPACASNSVSVRLGNGNGTFGAATTIATGGCPYGVAVADFDHDGKRDLAVANQGGDNVSFLRGNGNGTFAAAVNYPVGDDPYSIAAADFNGDGHPDLVTANLQSGDVSLLLGIGNGTFAAKTQWAANGDFPMYIAAGDLDADGRVDAFTANFASDDVSVLLNRTSCGAITNIAPNVGPTSGNQSVTISGTYLGGVVSVTFGGVEAAIGVSTPTSINVITPPHGAGAMDVVVQTAGGSATVDGGYTYADAPVAPASVAAEAVTAGRVDVTWSAVPGATSYQIDRKAPGGAFVQIGTATAPSYSDTTVSANTSYLYRVRTMNPLGVSSDSAADLATTVIFTSNAIVRAVHLAELRTAVNAVRALAGLAPASFTDSGAAGTIIKAVHLTELRTALDAARATLALPAGGYTNPSLAGIAIKLVHFGELQTRVR
ncbi:MAG: FG-GAP-like repeat-containing protein, partial [Thermoanaerobaculia bacterium]